MGVSKLIYNNETLVDTSNVTVSTETLQLNETAHSSIGEQLTGAAPSIFLTENSLVDGSFSGIYTNNTVKKLGYAGALRGLTNLTKVILPEVTTLEGYNFDGCTALESVELPKLNTITSNGYNFQNTAIQSFNWTISSNIPTYCFANCTALTSLSAPNITGIDRSAFNGSGLTTINDEMFPKLTGKVIFGTGNTTLVHVKLSGSGIRLDDGSGPFKGCSNLETLEFPNASTQGMGNMFAMNCPKLYLLDIGNSSIGANGCYGDYALTTIIIRKSSVASLMLNGLTNTPFRGYNSLTGTVYVPAALIEDYKVATNWSTLYTAGTCNFVAIEGSQYEV